MLTDRPVYATLPTADVARLRRFYEDVLGFTVQQETPTTIYYGAGEGTFFAISRSSGKAAGAHTQMAFRTTNIDADVFNPNRVGRANGVPARPTSPDDPHPLPVGHGWTHLVRNARATSAPARCRR